MVGWLMSDRELGKVLGVRLESFFLYSLSMMN